MTQNYIGVKQNMRKNTLLALSAALLLSSRAAALQPDFDGALAAGGAASLSELVAASAPEVSTAAVRPNVTARGWQNSSPCKVVELDSRDGAAINRRVTLEAGYTWQSCEDIYVTDSNGNSATVSQCHNESQWYDATVELIVHNRELRQFEKERIEVCYNFKTQKGSFALRQSPYEYTYRDKQGDYRYSVELFPGARKPQAPEASLAQLENFSYDDVRKEFTLNIRNGFTRDYAGRKVHIGVELVQDKLFNSSRGTKFFEFSLGWGQQDFRIVFKDSDFPSDKEAAGFRAKAKKYFVNWGFKVKGEGFTEAYIERGKTETVAVIQ